MSTNNEIRQTFFQECDELLEALDDGLSEIGVHEKDEEVDAETINSIFRAVHSIKGGAAAFGLDDLVTFSHQFETVLDCMREGRLRPDEDVLKVCHRAADHLNDLVADARDGREQAGTTGRELRTKLNSLVPDVNATAVVEKGEASEAFTAIAIDLPDHQSDHQLQDAIATPTSEKCAASDQKNDNHDPDLARERRIFIKPTRELYASGNDPSLILREIAELGPIRSVASTSDLPSL